ncbi:hypothetical protein FACS1894201_08650 [Bacteroidia bacterium]|nr:hypothetical protein FACS1894201_08650 [Bacteroidia bacterium]
MKTTAFILISWILGLVLSVTSKTTFADTIPKYDIKFGIQFDSVPASAGATVYTLSYTGSFDSVADTTIVHTATNVGDTVFFQNVDSVDMYKLFVDTLEASAHYSFWQDTVITLHYYSGKIEIAMLGDVPFGTDIKSKIQIVHNNSGGEPKFQYKAAVNNAERYEDSAPNNLGDWNVRAILPKTGFYTADTSDPVEFSIVKARGRITFEMPDTIYLGDSYAPINISSTSTDVIFEYKLLSAPNTAYADTLTDPAKGDYIVRGTTRHGNNSTYTNDTLEVQFKILLPPNHLQISLPADPKLVYLGPAPQPVVYSNTGGGEVSFWYKSADSGDVTYKTQYPTVPGSYCVKAKSAETNRYDSAESNVVDFRIHKAVPTLVISMSNHPYTPTPTSADAPVVVVNSTCNAMNTDCAPVRYWYKREGESEDMSTNQEPIAVGSYLVKATTDETSLYVRTESEPVHFIITKARPNISTLPKATAVVGSSLVTAVITPNTNGCWKWRGKTTESVGPVGVNMHTAIYTPKGNDTINYDTLHAELEVTVTNTTGIEELDEEMIKAYPNPANDVLYIEKTVDAEVCLYNLSGVLVIKTKENNINLSDYPAGSYILQIGQKTLRIVKR